MSRSPGHEVITWAKILGVRYRKCRMERFNVVVVMWWSVVLSRLSRNSVHVPVEVVEDLCTFVSIPNSHLQIAVAKRKRKNSPLLQPTLD